MKPSRAGAAPLPVILFEDREAWAAWLDERHATAAGVWLRLAKKGASIRSLSYAEALDEALCYGWIDSQKKGHDAESWIQKFTPRGPKSVWSKVNREKVQALADAGRMRPAGLRAVEAAKADGRWAAAYDSQRTATVPEDLAAALDGRPEAKRFFAALDGANRYAVLWRVQTARTPAARAKRIATLVEMLARGKRIHD